MAEAKTVKIENAKLLFRNFEGREGKYNREGDRSFSVIIGEDSAAELLADGWNVKELPPREEGDSPTFYLPVAVKFDKGRPPRIVLISSSARTNLDETTCNTLDWANISFADMILRAYEYMVNGKSGIKAYLQSLFVTIEEDDLERKYAINSGG